MKNREKLKKILTVTFIALIIISFVLSLAPGFYF